MLFTGLNLYPWNIIPTKLGAWEMGTSQVNRVKTTRVMKLARLAHTWQSLWEHSRYIMPQSELSKVEQERWNEFVALTAFENHRVW
jgi:hypothetical protein